MLPRAGYAAAVTPRFAVLGTPGREQAIQYAYHHATTTPSILFARREVFSDAPLTVCSPDAADLLRYVAI